MDKFKRFYKHFTPIFSGLSALAVGINAYFSVMYSGKPDYFNDVFVFLLFDSYAVIIFSAANIIVSIIYFILAGHYGLKDRLFTLVILGFNLVIIACWYYLTMHFYEQFPIFGLD